MRIKIKRRCMEMVTIERNMLKHICVKFDSSSEAFKSALSRLFEEHCPGQTRTIWELLKAQKKVYHEEKDGTALIFEIKSIEFPVEEFCVTIEVSTNAANEEEGFVEALRTAYQKLYPLLEKALADYIAAARTYEIIRKPLFDAIKSLLKVSSNEDKEVVRR